MRFLSLFSGIGAPEVAWGPLGWQPAAVAEIEKFPAAVLAHHWPNVPNLGDVAGLRGEDFRGLVDLVVGGFPCQSFSVAGRREGLDDPRGDLALKFIDLAGRTRARWLVGENVPGLMSHDGGRTFGTLLRALGERGYGFAYRVLDAQYFGVPQRRRRVFIVGYLGDWRPAAAVLFERHSLSWHSPPGRRKAEVVAGTLTANTFTGGLGGRPEGAAGNHILAHPLTAHPGRFEVDSETFIYRVAEPRLAHTLRGEGFDASEDGTGRQNLVVAFHGAQDPGVSGSVTHPLGQNSGLEACFSGADGVRRLTPLECERLQGFPDGHTLLKDWNGWRPLDEGETPEGLQADGWRVRRTRSGRSRAAEPRRWSVNDPDGPRYKALGNSMAVPVMRWIGGRIQYVENIISGAVTRNHPAAA